MKIKIRDNNESKELIGREFVVYAIEYQWSYCFYYICDVKGSLYDFSKFKPEESEIVDNRISKYWIIKQSEFSRMIAFPEWVNDSYFYEKMVGFKRSKKKEELFDIFLKYKRLIDKEFD